MNQLTPTSIRIESTFKAFGLDAGKSAGSTASIEFTVPDGMTRQELKRLTYEEKERLDKMVLTMELARGSVSPADYRVYAERLKQTYDQILKRGESNDNGSGPVGAGSGRDKAASLPVA